MKRLMILSMLLIGLILPSGMCMEASARHNHNVKVECKAHPGNRHDVRCDKKHHCKKKKCKKCRKNGKHKHAKRKGCALNGKSCSCR